MALGAKLKEARIMRHMTMSEVAKATRMKVQMIDDIEREDFSRIAAPIYGKGFIKLYAELVGLDPNPLINEYLMTFSEFRPASLEVEGRHDHTPAEPAATHSHPKETPPPAPGPDLFDHMAVPVPTGGQAKKSLIPENLAADLKEKAIKALGVVTDKAVALFSRFRRSSSRYVPEKVATALSSDSKAHRISLAVLFVVLIIFIISGLSKCSADRSDPAVDTKEKSPMQAAIQPPPVYVE